MVVLDVYRAFLLDPDSNAVAPEFPTTHSCRISIIKSLKSGQEDRGVVDSCKSDDTPAMIHQPRPEACLIAQLADAGTYTGFNADISYGLCGVTPVVALLFLNAYVKAARRWVSLSGYDRLRS